MNASGKDLSDLPGVVSNFGFTHAVHRQFDVYCGGAMAAVGWAAVGEPSHEVVESGHIEGTVLHADVDAVGPGFRQLFAALVREVGSGVGAHCEDGLSLFE